MDFTVDPLHDDIRRAVEKICAGFPDEYWMERDQTQEFPWDFYRAIADGGWLGLTVPEQYGGGGLGVTEAAIVEQAIAASGLPSQSGVLLLNCEITPIWCRNR